MITESEQLLTSIIKDENLDVTITRYGLFDCHKLGKVFDIIICYGLIYLFRSPQYCIDYISSLSPKELYISTQTHPGEDLSLISRRANSVKLPLNHFKTDFITGWHPTHKLFVEMLKASGFCNIVPLTDSSVNFPNKPNSCTNSAYYKMDLLFSVDPVNTFTEYYPR